TSTCREAQNRTPCLAGTAWLPPNLLCDERAFDAGGLVRGPVRSIFKRGDFGPDEAVRLRPIDLANPGLREPQRHRRHVWVVAEIGARAVCDGHLGVGMRADVEPIHAIVGPNKLDEIGAIGASNVTFRHCGDSHVLAVLEGLTYAAVAEGPRD